MASNFRSDENIEMATIPSFIKYGTQDSKSCFNIEYYTKYARYIYKIYKKKKIPQHSANTFPSVLSEY